MYQIFLIQMAFESSDSVKLDFLGFVIRICLNVKSQWTKNRGFMPSDPKYLRCETLYIGDYEYVNISIFAVLGIKPWLEEDGNLK